MTFPAIYEHQAGFSVPIGQHIYQQLDTAGDGTGTAQMAADHSGAAETFLITAPAGRVLHIARMIVEIQDNAAPTAEGYGGGSALVNGIIVTANNTGGDVEETVTPRAIKSNAHWAGLCFDAQRINWGAGDDTFVARLTFTKAGSPLVLLPGQSLRMVVNDDLSGLVSHCVVVHGYHLARS